MSKRRALIVIAAAMAAVLLDLILVRVMAHGHVAHVLLGAGSSAPPIGPALLAIALVLARFGAVVIAPGALLAAAASLVAHVVIGPKGGDPGAGQRGAGAPESAAGSSTRSGTGRRSEDEGGTLSTLLVKDILRDDVLTVGRC